uniref:Uncharacterized protein n=1 Tax=Arundo donax TaxID=35708 RepID=A0A0A9H5U3_ARUDO
MLNILAPSLSVPLDTFQVSTPKKGF